MVVGICGFGYTGSGAVKDFLLEFSDTSVVNQMEFGLVCGTDGLADLENHLMKPLNRGDSIYAIERYLKKLKRMQNVYVRVGGIPKRDYIRSINEFIDSISMVEWDDFIFNNNTINNLISYELLALRVVPHIERLIRKQISIPPMKKIHFSIMPSNFYFAAKKHVKQLISFMGADLNKCVVLDQVFSANNPQVGFSFFDDPRAIIVDRDPRDTYVFAREKLIGYGHFMPIGNVKDFVTYYHCLRDNQPYTKPDSRILVIKFEDMIYEYENTTKKIIDYLGLLNHIEPKKYFNPKISIANTQVYKCFNRYFEDIKYIEKELSEYLYDFDKYGIYETCGNMFV